jgi:DNA-binding transcriptional ArsR family regulator
MSRLARSKQLPRRPEHAVIFAALGDETRLSLVTKLSGGQPCSIAQLTADFSLTRQAITKHLRVLEGAGLVRCTRAGREARFQLDPKPLNEIKTYLERVSESWDQTLARLKSFVES